MQIFHGIAVSPGVIEGKVFRIEKGELAIPKYWLHDQELQEEVDRLQEALEKTHFDIEKLRDKLSYLSNREHLLILEAHMAMLKDPMLQEKTVDLIREEKINAEWALQKTQKKLIEVFSKIDQEYLRERQNDIAHVIRRIQDELLGKSDEIPNISSEVVLVAHDLSPVDLAHLPRTLIQGFATDVGGRTSHTGIVAASMEIPAVVGVLHLSEQTRNGDRIIIDGIHGLVILNPSPEVFNEYRLKKDEYKKAQDDLLPERNLPSETTDHHTVALMANMELKEEIPFIISQGAKGIGLFRTEFLFLEANHLPSEDEQFHYYSQILKQLAPYPVTIRTYDLGGEKGMPHPEAAPLEPNPALGLRAIRYCLKEPAIFRTQLRALARASRYGNLQIMFPLISSPAEFLEAKTLTQEVFQQLKTDNIPFAENIPLGVMIETPAAALTAQELAQICDFFSVGTNDLIQYTLAVDRVNENVAYLYNPLHPAILRMLKHVTQVAKRYKIPVNLCGEMASDGLFLPILVALGFEELSLNATVLPRVKHILRSLSLEDCNNICRRVIKYRDGTKSLRSLRNLMCRRFPEYFESEI